MLLQKWDGYVGPKHWSQESAPTGQDWRELSRQLLLTQEAVIKLEQLVQAQNMVIAGLLPASDAKPASKVPEAKTGEAKK